MVTTIGVTEGSIKAFEGKNGFDLDAVRIQSDINQQQIVLSFHGKNKPEGKKTIKLNTRFSLSGNPQPMTDLLKIVANAVSGQFQTFESPKFDPEKAQLKTVLKNLKQATENFFKAESITKLSNASDYQESRVKEFQAYKQLETALAEAEDALK